MGRKPHPVFQLFDRRQQKTANVATCKACRCVVDSRNWQTAAQHILYVCPAVSNSTRHNLQQELAVRHETQKVHKPRPKTVQGATAAAARAGTPQTPPAQAVAGVDLPDLASLARDMQVRSHTDIRHTFGCSAMAEASAASSMKLNQLLRTRTCRRSCASSC